MKRQEHKGINAKIMKIMSLALEISPADAEKKDGQPHVFVEYFPHILGLEVVVWLNGWEEDKDADYRAGFGGYHNNACEQADEIITYLENLKSSKTESGTNGR
ncbi:MAG: hypothetical protein K2N27_12650 [Ruminococcus sp.]|nr:hypothetical protein [Ruminococcus sp.]